MEDQARAPKPEEYLPPSPAELDIELALGEDLHCYAIVAERSFYARE